MLYATRLLTPLLKDTMDQEIENKSCGHKSCKMQEVGGKAQRNQRTAAGPFGAVNIGQPAAEGPGKYKVMHQGIAVDQEDVGNTASQVVTATKANTENG